MQCVHSTGNLARERDECGGRTWGDVQRAKTGPTARRPTKCNILCLQCQKLKHWLSLRVCDSVSNSYLLFDVGYYFWWGERWGVWIGFFLASSLLVLWKKCKIKIWSEHFINRFIMNTLFLFNVSDNNSIHYRVNMTFWWQWFIYGITIISCTNIMFKIYVESTVCRYLKVSLHLFLHIVCLCVLSRFIWATYAAFQVWGCHWLWPS